MCVSMIFSVQVICLTPAFVFVYVRLLVTLMPVGSLSFVFMCYFGERCIFFSSISHCLIGS